MPALIVVTGFTGGGLSKTAGVFHTEGLISGADRVRPNFRRGDLSSSNDLVRVLGQTIARVDVW